MLVVLDHILSCKGLESQPGSPPPVPPASCCGAAERGLSRRAPLVEPFSTAGAMPNKYQPWWGNWVSFTQSLGGAG